nr:MAG TPA: hypothetical protein [Caudoviricetes sp.]
MPSDKPVRGLPHTQEEKPWKTTLSSSWRR